MPTLDEVLTAFPDRRFLINIKSDDPDEGRRLAARLAPLPAEHRARIWVYGGGKAIDAFAADAPDLTVLGTDAAKRCLIRYELMGWLGIVPAACRHTLFMLPINYARFAWGSPTDWPSALPPMARGWSSSAPMTTAASPAASTPSQNSATCRRTSTD